MRHIEVKITEAGSGMVVVRGAGASGTWRFSFARPEGSGGGRLRWLQNIMDGLNTTEPST